MALFVGIVCLNLWMFVLFSLFPFVNVFSHNILLLGLLFSRPWVCRGWLLESSFSDHPAAPGTLLLLLLLLCWTTRIHFCSWAVFLKADYHYTTIFVEKSGLFDKRMLFEAIFVQKYDVFFLESRWRNRCQNLTNIFPENVKIPSNIH